MLTLSGMRFAKQASLSGSLDDWLWARGRSVLKHAPRMLQGGLRGLQLAGRGGLAGARIAGRGVQALGDYAWKKPQTAVFGGMGVWGAAHRFGQRADEYTAYVNPENTEYALQRGLVYNKVQPRFQYR